MIGYTTFSFLLLYFGVTFVIYSLSPKQIKWCVLLLGSLTLYFISASGNVS